MIDRIGRFSLERKEGMNENGRGRKTDWSE